MAYLDPTEYTTYGLAPDTTDDWVAAASSLIDSYCRRPTLNITEYTEKLRIVSGSQTVRLSFLPLAPLSPATNPLVNVQGRYARPRRGEMIDSPMAEIAWAFSLPGSWSTIDPATVEAETCTGEVTLPYNLMGVPFNEVQITYTAGLQTIPPNVKFACAQIVKNTQALPSPGVKMAKMDTLQMEYFAPTLIDDAVSAWLRPFVATRLG
jgi:hypothetical protein